MDEKLVVDIVREPFLDWMTLIVNGTSSEELDFEEVRMWFKVRGADELMVEKAMDEAYNFRRATVVINKPKIVKPIGVQPNI